MVSLFIKTWREDLKWLRYCLRFLEKNWTEPDSEVVVVLDNDCRHEGVDFDDYNLCLRLFYEKPWPDGYAHAMFVKACADTYCAGGRILLLDSDCMLLSRADAGIFFDELPVIPWISYEEHLAMYPHSPWRRVTERVLKIKSEQHYMPVMPILYWASTMFNLRRHVAELHGVDSFEEAVYSDIPFDPKNFSEHPHTFVDYDCLGLYAKRFESERYVFRHASKLASNPFKQFHSWTEWNDATPGILDRCLREAEAAAAIAT
jgi:hypothetical protein